MLSFCPVSAVSKRTFLIFIIFVCLFSTFAKVIKDLQNKEGGHFEKKKNK